MTKRKSDDCESIDLGDGERWFRGPMLGKGSFGSVYMATMKKPKTRLDLLPAVMAVKSAEFSVSGSIIFERLIMDRLGGCPGIVRCFGDEFTRRKDGQMVYNLLLEYASGGTLQDRIKKSNHQGLPQVEVRRYTRSILMGILNLHYHNLVHCDLKPANILLLPTSEGNFEAKICDLGLVKKVEESKGDRSKRTLRGTRSYLSPEALSDRDQEQPSDIWALGCIVLEMFTGQRPWYGREGRGILLRIQNEAFLPPKLAAIPEIGTDFLRCCLQRRVEERWTAEMLLRHPFVKL